jgi:hypothetical protein
VATLLAASLMAGTCEANSRLPVGPVGNVALFDPVTVDADSDGFGNAVAAGDFDGDGIDDLAVVDQDHRSIVRIYLGQAWTVGAPFAIKFMAETVLVPLVEGASAGPNVVLAVGDFDHDHDDVELAVGEPGDSFSIEGAGAVFVLDRAGDGTWSVINTIRQGFEGYPGISEGGDHFGAALAVGRFDQNSLDDLAIGIPGETTSGVQNSGVAYVVYGGVAGLYPEDAEGFYRGFNGLTGEPHEDEQLGFALAAGDFDGDGADDLAVGIPGATCAGFTNAGSVMVLRGQLNTGGLDAAGVQYWSQAMSGIEDSCETNDRFGTALVAGDFSQTPIGEADTADLAIGIPLENVDGVNGAGAVAVIYGSEGDGLTSQGNQFLHEGLFPGGTLEAALFGTRLGHAQFGDHVFARDSLLIGAPLATRNGLSFAGAVWSVPPSNSRLAPEGAQQLTLTPAYFAGPTAEEDLFGAQIVAGDFNGDDATDLALGIPGRDVNDADAAGAVQVLYQSEFIFIDSFD